MLDQFPQKHRRSNHYLNQTFFEVIDSLIGTFFGNQKSSLMVYRTQSYQIYCLLYSQKICEICRSVPVALCGQHNLNQIKLKEKLVSFDESSSQTETLLAR